MAITWELLCNEALRKIGVKKRIGSAYEGSEVAKACLELFSQTRDELLQREEWPFAMREVELSIVGVSAPSPWTFEYGYPSDCLRIRYLQPDLTHADPFDPQPTLFLPWNDQRPNPPIRAILSDTAAAMLIYVGRITDPNTWDAAFTHAFISSLAEHLVVPLAAAGLLPQEIAMAEMDRESAAATDDTAAPRRIVDMPRQADGNQR